MSFCFLAQNANLLKLPELPVTGVHQNVEVIRGLPKFLKLPITGASLLITFKAHLESWQAHKLPRLPVPRGPQNAHDFHRLPKFPKLLITGASIFSLDHQPSRLSSNCHRLPRFPKLLITKAFTFALDHQPSRQSSSHLDYQFPRGLKMHKIFIGYQSSRSYSLLSRLFLLSCSKC